MKKSIWIYILALVMRDTAITTVAVIGIVQLIKWGLAFVIISPVP